MTAKSVPFAASRIAIERCRQRPNNGPTVMENVITVAVIAHPCLSRARWNFGSFYLWGDVPALMPTAFGGKKSNHDGTYPNRDGWFGNYAAMKEGIKQRGSGREWFAGDGKISRMTSSGSPERKKASALIAKIPLPLSRHIARTYHPGVSQPLAAENRIRNRSHHHEH